MEICLLGLIQVHAAVCECYIDFFSFFLFGLYFSHIGLFELGEIFVFLPETFIL